MNALAARRRDGRVRPASSPCFLPSAGRRRGPPARRSLRSSAREHGKAERDRGGSLMRPRPLATGFRTPSNHLLEALTTRTSACSVAYATSSAMAARRSAAVVLGVV